MMVLNTITSKINHFPFWLLQSRWSAGDGQQCGWHNACVKLVVSRMLALLYWPSVSA